MNTNPCFVSTVNRQCPVCGATIGQPVMLVRSKTVCNSCFTKLKAKAKREGTYELRVNLLTKIVWSLRRRWRG